MIHQGDCIGVMAGMEPESVDAIVTDPPYGLEFMGKEWDRLWTDPGKQRAEGYVGTDGVSRTKTRPVSASMPAPTYRGGRSAQEFHARWAEAAYRVAKPSAYLLAFGGTRTVHRMTVALEDAGWIIRDMLVWAYASGFPKSKASLKPAWEPIVMARKPGPLRMLAIDECRIGTADDLNGGAYAQNGTTRNDGYGMQRTGGAGEYVQPAGRWPANVILTDAIFDGGIEGVVGGGRADGSSPIERPEGFQRFNGTDYNGGDTYQTGAYTSPGYGDSGTYSRFFLIPKADRADREPVLGGLPVQDDDVDGSFGLDAARPHTKPDYQYQRKPRANVHPTVKPVDLMRHLIRLVTPTGGVVLDPFLGSGTTGIAAEMEGFDWIGIEKEAEYVRIAEARLNGTQRGLGLPA